MSDIARCSGEWATTVKDMSGRPVAIENCVCPLRNDCLRFTIPEDRLFGSYIAPAYNEKKKSCWNLIQVRKGEE